MPVVAGIEVEIRAVVGEASVGLTEPVRIGPIRALEQQVGYAVPVEIANADDGGGWIKLGPHAQLLHSPII